jgi:hypothetical protein
LIQKLSGKRYVFIYPESSVKEVQGSGLDASMGLYPTHNYILHLRAKNAEKTQLKLGLS